MPTIYTLNYHRNKQSNWFAIWFCAIGGIAIVSLFLYWLNGRDERLMQTVEAYERCVITEYRTTPIAWRANHGEYPYCNPKPYLNQTNDYIADYLDRF